MGHERVETELTLVGDVKTLYTRVSKVYNVHKYKVRFEVVVKTDGVSVSLYGEGGDVEKAREALEREPDSPDPGVAAPDGGEPE